MYSFNSQIYILKTDRNLTVTSWDPLLEQITGLSSETVCGKPLNAIAPDMDAAGWLARFQRVLDEGEIQTNTPDFDRPLIPCVPSKSSRYFQQMQQRVTISPWRDSERIRGTTISIEDVTPLMDLEREMAEKLANPDETIRLQAAQALANQTTDLPDNPLVSAMGDESWRVRQTAVNTLVVQAQETTINRILSILREQHTNLSALNSALQVLALSNIDTLPTLIDWLTQSEDSDLRIYTALLLGEQKDPRAIQPLIEVLKDEDINVRYHVIEALGNLRAVEAVETLAEIAESRDFFLAFPALEALMRIGDPLGADRLVPLLEDEMLCEPAAGALGKLGDKQVVEPLAELLNNPSGPTLAISRAIATLYERYEKVYGEGQHIADLANRGIKAQGEANLIAALSEAKGEELAAVALLLTWRSGLAVEQALVQLLAEPVVRSMVMETLVNYGRQGKDIRSRVCNLLIEQLTAEQLETRRCAVVILGQIGDPLAVPALTVLLGDIDNQFRSPLVENSPQGAISATSPSEPSLELSLAEQEQRRFWIILERLAHLPTDPELIIVAAEALAKIGDRRSFEALMSLLGNFDAGVRQAAIAALNSLGHPDMSAQIFQRLQDENPRVRESAVKIAGYFAWPNCVDLLLQLCHDSNNRVRRAAIEHLPYLESDRVVPALVEAIHNEQPNVRASAARAFGQIDPETALPHLLKALNDVEPWVRYYSARSLGWHAGILALEALSRLSQHDPATHVRAAAIEALGQIGKSIAQKTLSSELQNQIQITLVQTLAPLATSESSEEDVARTAIAALGVIEHPHALEPLLTLLNSPLPARRIDALEMLGSCGNESVVESIQQLLDEESETRVVNVAIQTLGNLRSQSATEALIDLLCYSQYREAAISALTANAVAGHHSNVTKVSTHTTEEQIQWLERGLTHPDPIVRSGLVEVLTRFKHPLASRLLVRALDDGDASVRLSCIRALAHLGHRGIEEKLKMMTRNDPNARVRRAAQKVLQD
jgi:PAS domain S-box-containing protein